MQLFFLSRLYNSEKDDQFLKKSVGKAQKSQHIFVTLLQQMPQQQQQHQQLSNASDDLRTPRNLTFLRSTLCPRKKFPLRSFLGYLFQYFQLIHWLDFSRYLSERRRNEVKNLTLLNKIVRFLTSFQCLSKSLKIKCTYLRNVICL